MTAKRPIAYITAAWSGNRTADRERAAQYCRQVYEAGYSPLCPMLFLPVFLHESSLTAFPPYLTLIVDAKTLHRRNL